MTTSAVIPPYLPAADNQLEHRARQRLASVPYPAVAPAAPQPRLRQAWLGTDFTNITEKR